MIRVIVTLAVMLALVGCTGYTAFPNAGNHVLEARVGAQHGDLGIAVAPRYDRAIAEDRDVVTDLRVYGTVSALDVNSVQGLPLLNGQLYGGVFGGWSFEGGGFEAGWLIGGATAISKGADYSLDLCTEYQSSWENFDDGADNYSMIVGPRLVFGGKPDD